jgi:hypothetical protein
VMTLHTILKTKKPWNVLCFLPFLFFSMWGAIISSSFLRVKNVHFGLYPASVIKYVKEWIQKPNFPKNRILDLALRNCDPPSLGATPPLRHSAACF